MQFSYTVLPSRWLTHGIVAKHQEIVFFKKKKKKTHKAYISGDL